MSASEPLPRPPAGPEERERLATLMGFLAAIFFKTLE